MQSITDENATKLNWTEEMKSQFPDTIKGSQTKIEEIENALKTANDPTNESLPQLNQVQDEVDKE